MPVEGGQFTPVLGGQFAWIFQSDKIKGKYFTKLIDKIKPINMTPRLLIIRYKSVTKKLIIT